MELAKIKAYQTMPNIHSTDFDWINWYNALRSKYGVAFAGTLFLKVWAKEGTDTANTYALRQVIGADGVKIEEDLLNKASDIGNGVIDFGSGVIDSVGNFLKVGEYAVFAIGGILIIGLGIFVYNVAKNPGAVAGTAIKTAI